MGKQENGSYRISSTEAFLNRIEKRRQRLEKKFPNPEVVAVMWSVPQCEGTTKKGQKCQNLASGVVEFVVPIEGEFEFEPVCHIHKDQVVSRINQDLEEAGRRPSAATIGFPNSQTIFIAPQK